MATTDTLYLVDGHAVLYRFHYAFKDNPFRTSSGTETSAVYGLAKMVATLLKNYTMTHLGVIFDPPYRTWRKDFFPAYKSNRTDHDDISKQIELAYGMLNAWRVYNAAFRPLEADDVIGILARKAEAAGMEVRIATKDKDFCQLVTDKVKLLDLGKTIGKDEATLIDREGVKAKHGVYPEQIVDYLSMVGDDVDGVPGLNGVGKVTAADYLTKFGSMDGIYSNLYKLDKNPKKTTKKDHFESHREDMKRNQKLIRLAFEYAIPVELDELKVPPPHNPELFEYLQDLEFHSVMKILAE